MTVRRCRVWTYDQQAIFAETGANPNLCGEVVSQSHYTSSSRSSKFPFIETSANDIQFVIVVGKKIEIFYKHFYINYWKIRRSLIDTQHTRPLAHTTNGDLRWLTPSTRFIPQNCGWWRNYGLQNKTRLPVSSSQKLGGEKRESERKKWGN